MENEEKEIQQWFRANGFQVQLQIEAVNVSEDPDNPDNRPDHLEKYARVDRVKDGAEPQFLRRYKMRASDNVQESFRRVKELLEAEMKDGEI